MCRILYSLYQPNTEELIWKFLRQSDHLEKYTPGIDSPANFHTHTEGFGLAGIKDKKWSVYKTATLYRDVPNMAEIAEKMAEHPLVIGHIRRSTMATKRNNHPFHYRNHVFLHNGHLADYQSHRSVFLRKVPPAFRAHIKGDTDMEIMFYLFLSIIEKQEMSVSALRESVQQMFREVSSVSVRYNANVIYGNPEYSLITRYSHGKIDSPSLYLNMTRKGLLITSEPVSRKFLIIPDKTLIVVNHRTLDINAFRLT